MKIYKCWLFLIKFLIKKAKLVSNRWRDTFVKIFWWHEILADFCLNICFQESFCNKVSRIYMLSRQILRKYVQKRHEQMQEAAWKTCCYCTKLNYFFKNKKRQVVFEKLSRKENVLMRFEKNLRENENITKSEHFAEIFFSENEKKAFSFQPYLDLIYWYKLRSPETQFLWLALLWDLDATVPLKYSFDQLCSLYVLCALCKGGQSSGMQGQCIPDRCVPKWKFFDIASVVLFVPGTNHPWPMCPRP